MALRGLAVAAMLAAAMAMANGCSKDEGKSSSKGGQGAQAPGAGKTDAPAGSSLADRFDKVTVGMTADDAIKIMGEPSSDMTVGEIRQIWWRPSKDESYGVNIQDGKVVWTGGHNETQAKASGKQVAANWARVKNGMTKAEVIATIGQPKGITGAASGEGAVQTMVYEDDRTEYMVHLRDGKVFMLMRNQKDGGN